MLYVFTELDEPELAGLGEEIEALVGVDRAGVAVAGQGGGSEEKPVGLVWVALSGDKGCRVRRLDLSGKRRAAVKTGSSAAALEMIVEYLK